MGAGDCPLILNLLKDERMGAGYCPLILNLLKDERMGRAIVRSS